MSSNSQNLCEKHFKLIEAYCSDDCNLLCIHCILYDGHKGHQFQSIEDSIRQEYTKFISQAENAQINHSKAIKILNYLNQLNNECEQEHNKLLTDAQRYYAQLRQMIDEKELKLIENLNQCLSIQKTQISLQIQKMSQLQLDVEQYLEKVESIQIEVKDQLLFLSDTQQRNQILQKLPQNIVKPEINTKFPELNKENEANSLIKSLMNQKSSKAPLKQQQQQPPQHNDSKRKKEVKESSKKQPMEKSKKIPLAEMVPNSVQINLKKKMEENKQPVRLTNYQEMRNQFKERHYDKSQERRRDCSTPRRLYKNKSKQFQEKVSQSPFTNNGQSELESQSYHEDSMKQDFPTFLNSVQDFEADYSQINLQLDYSYITLGGFVDHLKQLVEKYDIKQDQSLEKDNLKCNRCKFGLAHLINGNVLLIGGKQDGMRLDSCEEYNYREKKVVASKIKLPQQRSGFGTLNVNQYIYIIGGHDGQDNLKDFDSFNQIDNTWSKQPHLLEARDELAVCIYENMIFAIGGFGGQFNTCLKTVEVYHQNKWMPCAPLNIARRALAAVALPDGIYAIGGFDGSQYLNSVEKYDDERWILIQSMMHPRCTLSALASPDNQFIYVFGGFDNGPLDSVEKYSVLNGKWEMTNNLMAKRFMHQTFLSLS